VPRTTRRDDVLYGGDGAEAGRANSHRVRRPTDADAAASAARLQRSHARSEQSVRLTRARALLRDRQIDGHVRRTVLGPDLQNILRFIVRLSYDYRKIDLRQ